MSGKPEGRFHRRSFRMPEKKTPRHSRFSFTPSKRVVPPGVSEQDCWQRLDRAARGIRLRAPAREIAGESIRFADRAEVYRRAA